MFPRKIMIHFLAPGCALLLCACEGVEVKVSRMDLREESQPKTAAALRHDDATVVGKLIVTRDRTKGTDLPSSRR